MYQPLIAFIWGAFLLPHGLDGHSLSLAHSSESTSGTNQSPTVSMDAPGPTLLSSKSFQSPFPQKGVSCKDLMPDALENFAAIPQLSQIFIQTALALALQSGGCTQHADILVLRLYRKLGKADTDALLSVMERSLGTASSSQSKSSAALEFNLDQLAYTQAQSCKGLVQIKGSVLHGWVHSVYRGFSAAAAACHQQGASCAGVASNDTGFYQVIERDGSYFLPHYGAHSWLHQCQKTARNSRSALENCRSEREQKVYSVVEWIPVVSTYYNFGTSIYYATQNCTNLAKERALEGAMDLGYDVLTGLTGGAGGVVRMGIAAGLKPVVKAGVRASINYFYPKEEHYPIPTSYSGPVIIT
ncbi:apolipoprotein F [Heteronotia binoei]|uniref:apolipoprotein F n=1 Tax=Heteronotia binoei TaxID=13085 RepID=UPI00292F9D63|nr:apolipoprotein F [Heteronotia binoei]XP_060108991.1 apolipoprotein F [Heteronotia binoei]